MAVENGTIYRLFVLLASGAYAEVGSGKQKGLKFPEKRDMLESSGKGDDGEYNEYGRYHGTITLDSMIVTGDAGQSLFKTALRTSQEVTIRISVNGTQVEEAICKIESWDPDYSDNTIVTASVSLRVQGLPYAVAP